MRFAECVVARTYARAVRVISASEWRALDLYFYNKNFLEKSRVSRMHETLL